MLPRSVGDETANNDKAEYHEACQPKGQLSDWVSWVDSLELIRIHLNYLFDIDERENEEPQAEIQVILGKEVEEELLP